MFEHFITLVKDVSSDAMKYLNHPGKDNRFIIYREFFQLPSHLKNRINKPFLQRVNRFIEANELLSFSFVRHPFER